MTKEEERPEETTNMELYSYQSLENRQIRLMKLDAGTGVEPLVGTLQTYLIDNTPKYEALSYTWGDSRKLASLACSGQIILLTQNLKAALLRLRRPRQPRLVWIDQICIDQDNTLERSEQVALMSSIYLQADLVLIWIGEDDEDTKIAFDFVPNLIRRFPSELNEIEDGIKVRAMLVNIILPMVRSQAWEALSKIFSRPWFRRVWVIQEVALASRAVVCCGSHELPWEDLVKVSRCQDGGQEIEDAHNAVAAITKLQIDHKRGGSNLTKALFLSYNFQCNDSRDKIYAMFGLANKEQVHDLRPDYTKHVQEVYQNLATSLITNDNCLDILCCVNHPQRIEGLSSWVPDWTSDVTIQRTLNVSWGWSKKSGHDLNKQSNPNIFFSDDMRTLFVQGEVIGSIEETGQTMPYMGYVEVIPVWRDLARNAGSVDGESFPNNYWRTLLADDSRGGAERDHYNRLNYDRWQYWNLASYGKPLSPDYEPREFLADDHVKSKEFHETMVEICTGRKLFTMNRNVLGLAPSEARSGDLVCILRGGPVPFVVRKNTLDGSHSLIGECYVQGHMNQQPLSCSSQDAVELFALR